MNILSFAARNLLRNRRRSALAALSVFLSIFMIVVLRGFADGFLDSIVKNYTKNETGHINIATKAYRDRFRFLPVDEYIEDSPPLVKAIQSALEKTAPGSIVAERIRFGVLLSSEKGTREALAIAGDPETERRLLMLDRSIEAGGSYLSGPGQTLVGASLAADLGLKRGGDLKLVTQKTDGGLGFKRLRIAGIFKTGVNDLDGSIVQMGLEDARELLGMEGGAQQIAVILSGRSKLGPSLDIVRNVAQASGNAGLSVLPWTAIGEYPKIVKLMEIVYDWVYLVVGFLGAFIIANVMMMVILERRREIGILMSMGMPKGRILGVFLLEGTMLGFIGSTAGVLVGFAFNLFFSKRGFDMTSAMAGFAWPLDNIIYPSTGLGPLLAGILVGTAVSAVMAYLPSRRAAAMAPVEAIRGQ
ncbi:MAG: FtsX-like permease family protein [Spirochaetes bacterium]|nr:FtsX-like permease family protein [Spirochaetota bacterium]